MTLFLALRMKKLSRHLFDDSPALNDGVSFFQNTKHVDYQNK